MRNRLRRVIGLLSAAAATWASAGCAAGYAPLECDPARGGELALGYQNADAFFPFPGTDANGGDFLFVDHACRYWAPARTAEGQAVPSRVVTGVLEPSLLAELNADLLTGPWATVDGEHVPGCCDGATVGLGRDAVRASVYSGAPRSDAFASLVERAAAWSERLGARGERVEGAVRLETRTSTTGPIASAIAWPLATPLTEYVGDGAQRVEGEDARLLRAASSSYFFEGDLYVATFLTDVVPFADETGCLRAVVSGSCRGERFF